MSNRNREFTGECIQSEDGSYQRENRDGSKTTVIAWRLAVLQAGDTQQSFVINAEYQNDLYESVKNSIQVGDKIRVSAVAVPGFQNGIKWRAEAVDIV